MSVVIRRRPSCRPPAHHAAPCDERNGCEHPANVSRGPASRCTSGSLRARQRLTALLTARRAPFLGVHLGSQSMLGAMLKGVGCLRRPHVSIGATVPSRLPSLERVEITPRARASGAHEGQRRPVGDSDRRSVGCWAKAGTTWISSANAATAYRCTLTTSRARRSEQFERRSFPTRCDGPPLGSVHRRPIRKRLCPNVSPLSVTRWSRLTASQRREVLGLCWEKRTIGIKPKRASGVSP